MHFLTAIGQRWKRAFGASLTIALLSAVAAVGFTVFGSKMLTACKAAGTAEQALASGSVLSLLNIDAPQATATPSQTKTEESILAKNWKNTDLPLLDSILKTNTLLDYNLVTMPNTPLPIIGGVSLSFNQIQSNPLLSPFANLIAISGALQFQAAFLILPYQTIVTNFLVSISKGLSVSNPSLAMFVAGISNAINATINSWVSFLRAWQTTINVSIPANYRPTPIPPTSPSSIGVFGHVSVTTWNFVTNALE